MPRIFTKKPLNKWPLAGAGVLALAAAAARPGAAQANARHLRANPHADGDGRTLIA